MRLGHRQLATVLAAILPATLGCGVNHGDPQGRAIRETRAHLAAGGTVDQPLPSGRTRLHQACEKGFERWARVCLEAGADPDYLGPDGSRPIHLVAANGHFPTLKVLLRYQPDVNAADAKGRSGLQVAMEHGRWAAARLLLMGRARPELPDEQGRTALHAAAARAPTDLIEKILEKSPACTNLTDRLGRTPLMIAARENRGDVALLLLRAGSHLDAIDLQGLSARDFASAPALRQLLSRSASPAESRPGPNQSPGNAD
jgi:cytohesin